VARTVAELLRVPGSRTTSALRNNQNVSSLQHWACAFEHREVQHSSARPAAQVVVYYVIALALYMQSSYREYLRCLLEAVQWLRDPSLGVRVAGKSGISQARTRLGWEPLRQLHDELVKPWRCAIHGARGIGVGGL